MTGKKIVIVGFGSVGTGLLPLLLTRYQSLKPNAIRIIAADSHNEEIAAEYGVPFDQIRLEIGNFSDVLSEYLDAGDFLINVSVDVSSMALIDWCQSHDVLYLDTCVEPWAGGYWNAKEPAIETTNYWLREQALSRANEGASTAVIAHGANPGLVSHLLKVALHNMASQKGILATGSYAHLAEQLGVKVVQISERDTQDDNVELREGQFVNTWSVDGFLSELVQKSELGLGSHENKAPVGSVVCMTKFGKVAVLGESSARVKVKSWVPSVGEQSAFLVTHHEAVSISDFLTHRDGADVTYRPTCYYAYNPTEKTRQSLVAWLARHCEQPEEKTILKASVQQGFDELGVLLITEAGSYWYGTTLSIEEAQRLSKHNNATSLQVNAAILGAIEWMVRNPKMGVVEAEQMNSQEILDVALPYLGQVQGIWSSWTPANGGKLLLSDFLEGGIK